MINYTIPVENVINFAELWNLGNNIILVTLRKFLRRKALVQKFI